MAAATAAAAATDIEELNRRIEIAETVDPDHALDLSGLNIKVLPPLPNIISIISCENNSTLERIEGPLPMNLRILLCEGTSITELPPLPNSVFLLSCSSTKISVLPELPLSLERLYISDTSIDKLPQLPHKLKYLYCNDTRIRELPNDLPPALKKLSCVNTEITKIPSLPPKMELLNCSDCDIHELPELPNKLEYLDTSDTRVQELPTLPDSIKRLYIGNTFIKELPLLPSKLETLVAYNTFIEKFDKLPPNLIVFNCNGCPIQTLPDLPETLELLVCTKTHLAFVPDDVIKGKPAIKEFMKELRKAEARAGVNNKFPITNFPQQVNVPPTVFDPYMAMNTGLNEFLSDTNTDNVVFITGEKSAYGFPRDELLKGLKDVSRIIYECKGKKGLIVRKDDLLFDTPYYRLMAPGPYAVPLAQFEKVLYSKGKIWKLVETEKKLDYVASRRVISRNNGIVGSINDYRVNLVGADHCQEGTGLKVYDIIPVAVGGRRKRGSVKRRGRRRVMKTRRRRRS